MKITGIWLKREQRASPTTKIQSQHAVVLIEVHEQWIEIIRENVNGPFSHIIEESGMKRAVDFACEEQSYSDLANSGDIVEAP